MRKLILSLVAAIAALAVAGPASAATKVISIYGSGFSPKSTTITEGDTVTWKNRDNANHQVLADKGQFVSPIIRPNQTYSFTFRASGTYTYKDELHPKLTGKLVVKGLPPTLTLLASAPIVTSGTKVTLSGVVSSKKPGESVTIYYQPYPQPNLIQRATVLTGTGRHVQLHRRPADPDELSGRLEGRVRDADHRPGRSRTCRSAATTAGSSTPRPPTRSRARRCSSSA